MLLRLFHAFIGAVLGAVFGAGFGLVFVEFNLNLISICAGIAGVLAFVWGEPVINWLRRICGSGLNGGTKPTRSTT